MGKIGSDDVADALNAFLANGGKIRRMRPGQAENATKNGSVCAGGFSSRAMSQAQARAAHCREMRAKAKQKLLRRKGLVKKSKSGERPATKRQIVFLAHLGGRSMGFLTKRKASNLIDRLLRETKEFNARQRKALG